MKIYHLKFFAISYSINNFDIPKSVRNNLDLHIYKAKID